MLTADKCIYIFNPLTIAEGYKIMAVEKSIVHKLESMNGNNLVCSECARIMQHKNEGPYAEGDFSKCCTGVVLQARELLKAYGGMLPSINELNRYIRDKRVRERGRVVRRNKLHQIVRRAYNRFGFDIVKIKRYLRRYGYKYSTIMTIRLTRNVAVKGTLCKHGSKSGS